LKKTLQKNDVDIQIRRRRRLLGIPNTDDGGRCTNIRLGSYYNDHHKILVDDDNNVVVGCQKEEIEKSTNNQ
jgi:hypothetical protein